MVPVSLVRNIPEVLRRKRRTSAHGCLRRCGVDLVPVPEVVCTGELEFFRSVRGSIAERGVLTKLRACAGGALRSAAEGEITARGRHASAIASAPHRPVFSGHAPAPVYIARPTVRTLN